MNKAEVFGAVLLIVAGGVRTFAVPDDLVAWDHSTRRIIRQAPTPTGQAFSGRIAELPNGDWLCVHDAAHDPAAPEEVYVSKSTDKGSSWSLYAKVTNETQLAANGELQILPNGDLICAYRIGLPEVDLNFALKVAKSTDGGASWQYLSTIIANSQGAWEPDFLWKDDGELLVFYANDDNSTGYDQCIEMMRSNDNAATWHSRQLVSGFKGSRDGMPVPVLLENDDILVVMEGAYSNDPPYQGRWIIMSVRSTDGGDTWGPRTIAFDPRSPTAAFAPFVVRSHRTGKVLLSCQTNEEGQDLAFHKMKVLVSADNGHSFVLQKQPFSTAGNASSIWNSLFMQEPNVVVAVTSTPESGRPSVQMIKGTIQSTDDLTGHSQSQEKRQDKKEN